MTTQTATCGETRADGTACPNAAGCRIRHPVAPAATVPSSAGPSPVDGGYGPQAADPHQELWARMSGINAAAGDRLLLYVRAGRHEGAAVLAASTARAWRQAVAALSRSGSSVSVRRCAQADDLRRWWDRAAEHADAAAAGDRDAEADLMLMARSPAAA